MWYAWEDWEVPLYKNSPSREILPPRSLSIWLG